MLNGIVYYFQLWISDQPQTNVVFWAQCLYSSLDFEVSEDFNFEGPRQLTIWLGKILEIENVQDICELLFVKLLEEGQVQREL